jgi:hypothetical protein
MSKLTNVNPIVGAPGDDFPEYLIRLIHEKFFKGFPIRWVDLSVDAVLSNRNKAISEFVDGLEEMHYGFKGSTSSQKTGGSINPAIRKLTGGVCAFRMSLTSEQKLAVLRYFFGGIYSQTNPRVRHSFDTLGFIMAWLAQPLATMNQIITQKFADLQWSQVTLYTTQSMRLDTLPVFAKIAELIARQYELEIATESKDTVAIEDEYFKAAVCGYFEEHGIEYTHKLTDLLVAEVPNDKETLYVVQNYPGDIISDVACFVEETFDFFSTVYCQNGNIYEEMSLGSDTKQFAIHLKGEETRHDSLLYFFMLANSYKLANAGNEEVVAYCDNVFNTARAVHQEIGVTETFAFINEVANRLAI